MLQNNPVLKSLINSLWNTLWSGGIANPITAIEQITYLLFIKQLDRIEQIQEQNLEAGLVTPKEVILRFKGTYLPFVNETELRIEAAKTITSKVQIDKIISDAAKPRPKSDLRWNYFHTVPVEKLSEHIRFNVFPFIQKLNGEASLFTKYMGNAVFILEKPSLLIEAISKIDELYIEIERDAKEGGHNIQDIQGDVYEMLLGEIAQAGKNGQFRTPRHIIKFMTNLVRPKLGDKIADPTCGTGGFLVGAYQYILTELIRKHNKKLLEKDDDGFEVGTYSAILDKKTKNVLDKNLFGFDIDVTMVRLGLMNLTMHGIDNPQMDLKDTLSKSFNQANQYDIILANPPFTGKIDRGDVNSSIRVKTASTELLFLDRISAMLNINGKAAIIIPEGVLFGSSNAHKATRQLLLKDNDLEAIISLPSGAFKPYTGVKTAILIIKKIEENSKEYHTRSVWFYNLKGDGYSLDDNRRRLKGFPLIDAKNAFDIRTKTKGQDRKDFFYVPIDDIIDNDFDLSYNRYRQYEYIEQQYEPPKDILSELIKLENEIIRDMKTLNELIG